jgi:lipopolysaccharide transport system ATP-binding protein
MAPAIRVENLSKRYRIRHAEGGYRTLRDSLAGAAVAPWRRLRARLAGTRRTAAPKPCEDFWALKDVSFEVPAGKAVGIIGRNGAGKSTLLKILSRITKPTGGHAEVRGRVGSLLEVGTGFHPELTGRENIFLNGSILGMGRREIARSFDAIVAFAEVERFLDTPVKRYSSGMYVRLAFAVAAHLEPEILLVDEVLAVGDAAFQKKCLGKMGSIARGGRTVVFVSHNMGTVAGLCETAVRIEGGTVYEIGPARRVVEAYLADAAYTSPPWLDLSDKPRASESGRQARLKTLEWLTPLPLQHGEPARLRVHFSTSCAHDELAVGVGLATLEGARFLTFDSDFATGRRSLPAGQGHAVELSIPALPLSPGVYALDLGIRSGDRFGLDYLPGVTQIEVVAGSRTPSFMMQHPSSGVRIGCDWDWGLNEGEGKTPCA